MLDVHGQEQGCSAPFAQARAQSCRLSVLCVLKWGDDDNVDEDAGGDSDEEDDEDDDARRRHDDHYGSASSLSCAVDRLGVAVRVWLCGCPCVCLSRECGSG